VYTFGQDSTVALIRWPESCTKRGLLRSERVSLGNRSSIAAPKERLKLGDLSASCGYAVLDARSAFASAYQADPETSAPSIPVMVVYCSISRVYIRMLDSMFDSMCMVPESCKFIMYPPTTLKKPVRIAM
jgi:hypothetical protein